MENHFATIEVRESVLFAVGLMPASEGRQLFQKCSLDNIAESSFKKIAENPGPGLEKHLDAFWETIRREETLPVEQTKVVAVSMAGANVLLQEPGKNKGRKRQRPGTRKLETDGSFDSPTSYRNAVEAIFGKRSGEGEAWYDAKKAMLLEEYDGSEKVYRSLVYFRDHDQYPKDRRETLNREITFFRNTKDRMEYKRFRENGWPIGSGVIEAACKSVVKCRFCRSGMRWTRVGGQVILTLRTLIKSDPWEAFGSIYKTSRFTRPLKSAA